MQKETKLHYHLTSYKKNILSKILIDKDKGLKKQIGYDIILKKGKTSPKKLYITIVQKIVSVDKIRILNIIRW